jgi:uncharacterized ParB-like nuclease family protein
MMPEVHLAELKINQIRTDGGTQSRVKLCQETVEEYADYLRAEDELPPVIAFFDPAERVYWLAAGFHRLAAHALVGRKTITADVRRGTRREAVLFSVGSNVKHGLKRSREDKRYAVGLLLADDERKHWSDREIARRCGVSDHLVRLVREELAPKVEAAGAGASAPNAQMRTARRGESVYEIDTGAFTRSPSLAEREAEAVREFAAEDRQELLRHLGKRGRSLAEESRDLGDEGAAACGHLTAFVGEIDRLSGGADSAAA